MSEDILTKRFDMFGVGSLKDRIKQYNTVANVNQNKLDQNPFSDTYKIRQYSKEEQIYGRPEEGSLTHMRGVKAGNHVYNEIIDLCEVIGWCGVIRSDGVTIVRFQTLFQAYTRISDKVVGMLLRARKYGLVEFEGEMLYQGQDNNKIISMPRSYSEIKRCFKYSGDPANLGRLISVEEAEEEEAAQKRKKYEETRQRLGIPKSSKRAKREQEKAEAVAKVGEVKSDEVRIEESESVENIKTDSEIESGTKTLESNESNIKGEKKKSKIDTKTDSTESSKIVDKKEAIKQKAEQKEKTRSVDDPESDSSNREITEKEEKTKEPAKNNHDKNSVKGKMLEKNQLEVAKVLENKSEKSDKGKLKLSKDSSRKSSHSKMNPDRSKSDQQKLEKDMVTQRDKDESVDQSTKQPESDKSNDNCVSSDETETKNFTKCEPCSTIDQTDEHGTQLEIDKIASENSMKMKDDQPESDTSADPPSNSTGNQSNESCSDIEENCNKETDAKLNEAVLNDSILDGDSNMIENAGKQESEEERVDNYDLKTDDNAELTIGSKSTESENDSKTTESETDTKITESETDTKTTESETDLKTSESENEKTIKSKSTKIKKLSSQQSADGPKTPAKLGKKGNTTKTSIKKVPKSKLG